MFKYVQLYHQKFFGASVCWLVFCVSGLTLDLEQRKTRSTSHASKLVKRPQFQIVSVRCYLTLSNNVDSREEEISRTHQQKFCHATRVMS